MTQAEFNAMLQTAIAQGLPGGYISSRWSWEEMESMLQQITTHLEWYDVAIVSGTNLGYGASVWNPIQYTKDSNGTVFCTGGRIGIYDSNGGPAGTFGGNPIIFYLAQGFRPRKVIRLPAVGIRTDKSMVPSSIDVDASGGIQMHTPPSELIFELDVPPFVFQAK